MSENEKETESMDTGSTQGQASRLAETTKEYAAKCEAFAQTKFGNAVIAFVNFEKNIVPYTLQIFFVLGVVAAWVAAIMVLFGAGGMAFTDRLVTAIALLVAGPFVIHYLLEILKYAFVKIAMPLWDKLVIRFLVNVLPESLPFFLERVMKAVDIALDGTVVVFMAVAGVLKGVLWLPKTLCQRLARWCAPAD